MYISPRLWLLMLLICLGASLSACSEDTAESHARDEQDAGEDTQQLGDADTVDAHDAHDAHDAANDAADDAQAKDTLDAENPDDADHLLVDADHHGCDHPASPDADCWPDDYGDFGPASFIDHFYIEKSGACCTDMTGNGSQDSALGSLIDALSGIIGVPFNDVIEAQLQAGNLIFLFEYGYLSDPVNDPAFQINLVFGEDTDSDFAPNLEGQGDFTIDPGSLDSEGNRRSNFPTATLQNGRFSVANGSAALRLPLNVNATLISEIQLERLSIEADIMPGADLHAAGRIALAEGRMSAAVPLSDFYGALNEMAAPCSCISSQPLFVESSPEQWSCAEPLESDCRFDPDPLCKNLGDRSRCNTITDVVNTVADIDLNDNNSEDALSLGATFTAVGASIQGVGN